MNTEIKWCCPYCGDKKTMNISEPFKFNMECKKCKNKYLVDIHFSVTITRDDTKFPLKPKGGK